MQDKLITLSGLEDLIQKANDLIRAAKAPSTRKAYQSDFRMFESWCTHHALASLPSAPETIALYIASCVVVRPAPATIARRLASISKTHQAAGFENSPASTKHFVVGEVLKGARRSLGVAQKCNDICRLLAACPKNLLGLRDRALILIGFAGAFRRSELCAMTVSGLCFSDSGLVINVPRSKADQEQAGDKVAIPFGEHNDTCPIRALRQWLKAANVKEGAVFRGVDRHGHVASTGLHRDSIAVIFKAAAARAGLNATNIAGHSVRAGMATQAALNGFVRARYRENHAAPFASRFAALYPAGRDVPRERVGDSGPLAGFPGIIFGPGKSPLLRSHAVAQLTTALNARGDESQR